MWIVTMKYGCMRSIANFKSSNIKFKIGERGIIKTERGTEVGEVLSEPEEVDEKNEALQYLHEIIRKTTEEDEKKIKKIREVDEPKAVDFCLARVRELKLQMDILCAEQLFGYEKLVFYFFAAERIDFRKLVTLLAKEFKTRIEMRQVGIRDAARLNGDCGICGAELCCKGWMRKLEPVSLKFAKIQNLPLDIDRLAGFCGRLKCCIRFENAFYTEQLKDMPTKGSRVLTKQGEGKVKDLNIFNKTITLESEDGKIYTAMAQDIIQILETFIDEQKDDTQITQLEDT